MLVFEELIISLIDFNKGIGQGLIFEVGNDYFFI